MVEKLASNYPAWAASDTLVASAAAFFTRFYVSNSCMEYDPMAVGLACLLVASKAEGTWGFLPALTLGLNGAPGSVRLRRDDSIHTKVPVRGGPRDAFALVSSEAASSFPARVEDSGGEGPGPGPGSFFAVADPDAESAGAVADRVLDAELSVLGGNAFYLLVHHPFNSLHALVRLLAQGAPPAETPLAPPAAPSSSSALAAPPFSAALEEGVAGEDEGASFDPGARLLARARGWLRRALCSDLPLLFAPAGTASLPPPPPGCLHACFFVTCVFVLSLSLSPPLLRSPAELALAALLATAGEDPDCLPPLGLDINRHGAAPAIVARLQTQAAAATEAGAAVVGPGPAAGQLSPAVLARAAAAQAGLQALKASKPAKGQLKAAQAKLSACALWREGP
jgi:hypothetical protein